LERSNARSYAGRQGATVVSGQQCDEFGGVGQYRLNQNGLPKPRVEKEQLKTRKELPNISR
jgi:hypothetical protein